MKFKLSEIEDKNINFARFFELTESSFDNNYNEQTTVIGKLRWSRVSNAGYRFIHPVYNDSLDVVGHIFRAMWKIGYTYNAIYSDYWRCFIIAASPVKNSSCDLICFVEEAFGGFALPKVQKVFNVTEYITLPSGFVNSGLFGFKLSLDKQYLVAIGKSGICYVDVANRKLHLLQIFGKSGTPCYNTVLAQSPVKQSVVVVAFSDFEGDDPLTGKATWHHQLEIHDFEEQRLLGSYSLKRTDSAVQINNIGFLDTGKSILISLGEKILRLDAE